MTNQSFQDQILSINFASDRSKQSIVDDIASLSSEYNFNLAGINTDKPWGAFVCFDNQDADKFVTEFFPEITPAEARLGHDGAQLSPKILLVSPGQRLSWQYHHLRAERWKFLTGGAYYASHNDSPGDQQLAAAGSSLQLACGERHRLVGSPDSYTVVAEIWQHVDVDNLSNEADIVRLSDDYQR